MKITWASNAPWAGTGYGTQTQQMLKRLLADGHEVAIAANFGLFGRPMPDPETGAPVFPMGADAYSNDVMLGHHNLFTGGEPGWIITLFDVWVYNNPEFDNARIASWTPVDHAPVPPKVADWCRKHKTIAMSQFGRDMLEQQGIKAHYAPHALDLTTWKPTPTLPDGQGVRAALQIPEDAFLVMINAANKGNVPPRKAWSENIAALGMFMTEHPDVYAYIHTDAMGVYGGIQLPLLLGAVGIDGSRIRWPDQYANIAGLISQEQLAAHYTASDVLLAASMGEGFGLTVLEAQACGTPVIVNDFSAQPELVGAGWKVGNQPYWDFTQAAWFCTPLISHIKRALEEAYERKGEAELTEKALAKAAEYEADKVYAEHWRPILAEMEEELKPKVKRQVRRAKNKRRAA